MTDQPAKVKLGGLWMNTTANGDTYFSGSIGMGKLMAFKNGYKEKETDPDYILYVGEGKKKEAPAENSNVPF